MPNLLPIHPKVENNDEATEMLRLFVKDGKTFIMLRGDTLPRLIGAQVNPQNEAMAWGIALADVARHVADLLKQGHDVDKGQTLSIIDKVIRDELDHPSDSHIHGDVKNLHDMKPIINLATEADKKFEWSEWLSIMHVDASSLPSTAFNLSEDERQVVIRTVTEHGIPISIDRPEYIDSSGIVTGTFADSVKDAVLDFRDALVRVDKDLLGSIKLLYPDGTLICPKENVQFRYTLAPVPKD